MIADVTGLTRVDSAAVEGETWWTITLLQSPRTFEPPPRPSAALLAPEVRRALLRWLQAEEPDGMTVWREED